MSTPLVVNIWVTHRVKITYLKRIGDEMALSKSRYSSRIFSLSKGHEQAFPS